ncbi:MAG: helix-turn-helix domain-containing protein [Victivallaceae bacterium]
MEKAGQSSEILPRFRFRQLYLHPVGDESFAIDKIGIEERMRPCLVNRPDGTADWLLMFFLPGAMVRDGNGDHVLATASGCLWPPGCRHFYGELKREWLHSWIHFSGVECEALIREHGIAVDRLLPVDYRSAVGHLEYLRVELEHDRSVLPEVLKNVFRNLLWEFRRGTGPAAPIPPRIAEVRQWIERNYRREITLTGLARRARLSVTHFSAEFRRCCGVSPIESVLALRLQEGAYLLRNHNLSIAEIARGAGFRDPFYFSRLFRRRYGVSPREYRRN